MGRISILDGEARDDPATRNWDTVGFSIGVLQGDVGAADLGMQEPTGCLYDFPTSSERRLPNIVDAKKKRQDTPLEIETVIHSKRGACHGSRLLRSPSQSPTLMILHPNWTRGQFSGAGSFENPSILEAAPRHNADRHSAQVQGLYVHDAHSVASCS